METAGQDKLERIRLVARVQLARDAAIEAVNRSDGSARARAVAIAARTRLALLNRALAIVALADPAVPSERAVNDAERLVVGSSDR
jgi:hypothetical protein